MLTKEQKSKQIEEGIQAVKESNLLIFADFSGTAAEELRRFRKILKEAGLKFKLIKKRLLRIVFEKTGFGFNPEKFEAQVGTIFSPKEIIETAGLVYRFSKENKNFKILGGYDLANKIFVDSSEISAIGSLPGREVLLGRLVGMLAAPLRMFLYVLNEKGRKNG